MYNASRDCIGEAGMSTTFKLKQSSVTLTGDCCSIWRQAPQQGMIIEMSAIPGEAFEQYCEGASSPVNDVSLYMYVVHIGRLCFT